MDSILNFASQQLQSQMGGGQQQQQGNQQQSNQQQGNNNQQQQGNYDQQQGNSQQQGNDQQQQGGNFDQQQGGNFNQQQGSNLDQQGSNQQQSQQQQQHASSGAVPAGGLSLMSLISGANAQHGNGDQISGLIQAAMGSINKVQPDSQVDESKVQANHDQAYNQGNTANMSASAMGSAAALQAFKSFASGGSGAGAGAGATDASGGGSMIQKLLGMAMSEAVKLFQNSGGPASGTEQDVVSSAGSTMMKLMVQNQIAGALGGGGGAAGGAGGGGQAGQLLSLASKFLS